MADARVKLPLETFSRLRGWKTTGFSGILI